jgi:putative transposase
MSSLPYWHHAPPHVFAPGVIQMITGATLHKEPLFLGEERLRILESTLFEAAGDYRWNLEAWALFPNHYHIIARPEDSAKPLKTLISRIHSQSARLLNRHDGEVGREVWFQFWDTCLTHETSYLARLKYVHTNPVKHGLVGEATLYPFCSAAWFEARADATFCRKVMSFGCERVNVRDDF